MNVEALDKNNAGNGRISLSLHGNETVFTELSYQYPLKLLSPRVYNSVIAIAYILSYGGGLVSGDRIKLDVEVLSGAVLLLLTQVRLASSTLACDLIGIQGSTKVFKYRIGQKLAKAQEHPHDAFGQSTVQKLRVDVFVDGLLVLLPDPVTCFSEASYNQIQTFRLQEGASAVILDWLTSGRMSRGEAWKFSRYYSVNEVNIGGRRIARDTLLLQDTCNPSQSLERSVKDRMGDYSCYATVMLCGPRVRYLVEMFSALYRSITIYQQSEPGDLLWSMADMETGCVIRVAGKETDSVRCWLRDHLRGLETIIGSDVYSKAFV